VLERLDNRYVVSERKVVYESEVLSPVFRRHHHRRGRRSRFIDGQYELAGVDPGDRHGRSHPDRVAVRRSNARAIGELLRRSGEVRLGERGDALEATLAAFGSGACAARSANPPVS